MTGKRYTPPMRMTWFCTQCAREGRRHIVVDVRFKTCPYGHKRKAKR